MTEPKFTPGPMTTFRSSSGFWHILDGPGFVLADMQKKTNGSDEHLARLFAASPELYAACEAQEKFDRHCSECESCSDGYHCVDGAELSTKAQDLRTKAMSKARGEA